jgi:hypothetical protein
MTNRDDRVRTAILGRALHAQPVSLESVAAATGLTLEGAKAALVTLHEVGAIYLRDGAVVAAYPFSLVPTPHRVTIAGVTVHPSGRARYGRGAERWPWEGSAQTARG